MVTNITDPAVEPVTLAQMKTFLRGISHSDHDDLLTSLIQAARERAESFTNRLFVQRSATVYFKAWPDEVFELPYPELQSVTSVKYTDTDGDQSTFSSSNYSVDTNSEPGRVVLGYSKTWPTATLHDLDYPIEIAYVCGYAATNDSPVDYRANIPEGIKTAIKLDVDLHYSQPPEQVINALWRAIESLLTPYKVWRF